MNCHQMLVWNELAEVIYLSMRSNDGKIPFLFGTVHHHMYVPLDPKVLSIFGSE